VPEDDTSLRSALRQLAAEADKLGGSDATAAGLARLIAPLETAVFVADSRGRFVAANAAATELTGYAIAELLELSVAQITPSADERESETLWRVFLQQQQQRGNFQLLRKDGGVIAAEYAAMTDMLPGLHVSIVRVRTPASP